MRLRSPPALAILLAIAATFHHHHHDRGRQGLLALVEARHHGDKPVDKFRGKITADGVDHRPLCAEWGKPLGTGTIPKYVVGGTLERFEEDQAADRRKLERNVEKIRERIKAHDRTLRLCIHMANKKTTGERRIEKALDKGGQKAGMRVIVDKNKNYRGKTPPSFFVMCTFDVVWGARGEDFFKKRRKAQFPHLIVLERPWFWRTDPVNPDNIWAFLGWDYLNGYALRREPNPPDRWEKHFAKHIPVLPWAPASQSGHVLLLGQIPSDVAVASTEKRFKTIDNAYSFIVKSIREQLPTTPIIYRPHPEINETSHVRCKLDTIDGVITETHLEKPLPEALDGAVLVVAISSTAVLEAVFRGIPSIVLDPIAPTWPVSCHNFTQLTEIVKGTACRPDRSQWLADIAYTMWPIDEIEKGEAFRYLLELE